MLCFTRLKSWLEGAPVLWSNRISLAPCSVSFSAAYYYYFLTLGSSSRGRKKFIIINLFTHYFSIHNSYVFRGKSGFNNFSCPLWYLTLFQYDWTAFLKPSMNDDYHYCSLTCIKCYRTNSQWVLRSATVCSLIVMTNCQLTYCKLQTLTCPRCKFTADINHALIPFWLSVVLLRLQSLMYREIWVSDCMWWQHDLELRGLSLTATPTPAVTSAECKYKQYLRAVIILEL